jgi:type II secretory pathway pseudopilin PulG
MVEALVVLVVMCVLISMGLPQFQVSLEKARADVAGANLRSIWSAQRLYWLENRTYSPDLPTLQSANLIDPSLATTTAPYTYSMTVASDGSTFTATATRSGPTSWSGSFTIYADGSFPTPPNGPQQGIQQAGQGPTIVPDFQ